MKIITINAFDVTSISPADRIALLISSKTLELAVQYDPVGLVSGVELHPTQGHTWFHGPLRKDLAVALLQDKREGTFLIRQCPENPKTFSMALASPGHVEHREIVREPDGMFTVEKWNMGLFMLESLNDVVETLMSGEAVGWAPPALLTFVKRGTRPTQAGGSHGGHGRGGRGGGRGGRGGRGRGSHGGRGSGSSGGIEAGALVTRELDGRATDEIGTDTSLQLERALNGLVDPDPSVAFKMAADRGGGGGGEEWVAMHDYQAVQADELEFSEGDHLVNVVIKADGWATGTHLTTGMTGMLPANFIKRLGVENDRSPPLHPVSSTPIKAASLPPLPLLPNAADGGNNALDPSKASEDSPYANAPRKIEPGDGGLSSPSLPPTSPKAEVKWQTKDISLAMPLGIAFKQLEEFMTVTKIKTNSNATGKVKAGNVILSINGKQCTGKSKTQVAAEVKASKSICVIGIGIPWWDRMDVSKSEALAVIKGKPSGAFVLRATERGYATLSLVKPDGKLFQKVVEIPEDGGGFQLKGSPITFPTVAKLVAYYSDPTQSELPCSLLAAY
jgi:hypothetical protein